MTKKLIITGISLMVGALHFVKGQNYQGLWPNFVNGYMLDILLPMTLYLLLGLFQNKFVRLPIFRAGLVFGFSCLVEASQYFGFPIFGTTFDPFDLAAYAGGIALGIFLDLVFFPRWVLHWQDA